MLTFGSLFAGIGGIDLGLERSGMVCRWQVEIDDYATRVLAKHWPNVPRFRDVRDCGAYNLASVDLVAGGFPCQDISSAGKRAGITGTRSGLWSEFARIIGELRPRFVLVENVPALLYPVRRGKRIVEPAPIGRVLGDLVACGYDAEWQCIPAAALGAPHIRDRVYIVAYADRLLYRHRYDGASSIFQIRPQSNEGLWQSLSDPEFWTVKPGVGRVAHGVPNRVDRLRGLGNAVVPQVAEWIGQRIVESEAATLSE